MRLTAGCHLVRRDPTEFTTCLIAQASGQEWKDIPHIFVALLGFIEWSGATVMRYAFEQWE